MRRSQRTLFFVICDQYGVSLQIKWIGARVGVVFTLENLRDGEDKKSEPQA